MNAAAAVAPPRLREWWAVVKEEKKLTGSWPNPFKMVRGLFRGHVSHQKWTERLVTCSRCPIFDGELRRCRGPFFTASFNRNTGARNLPPGCGCYVPYLAFTKTPYTSADRKLAGCWGRATMGASFGWE